MQERSSALAVASEDAGFWPVIRLPSVTVCASNAGAPENVAPSSFSFVSKRNGMSAVSSTASSSSLVKPVTFLP